MNENKIIYKYLKEIDLSDSFFDSLRMDYNNFNLWYQNKISQNSHAYVTYDFDKLTSFLLLKIEDENEEYKSFTKKMPPLKRVKICTFKVNENNRGIGSTYINIINNFAINNNTYEIYITIFDKQRDLIKFLLKNNFKFYCKKINNNGIENVYIKKVK